MHLDSDDFFSHTFMLGIASAFLTWQNILRANVGGVLCFPQTELDSLEFLQFLSE